jgi:hypothetical protein
MSENKYVYIVGAGLTKALEGRLPVPLMADFIPVMAEYIQNPVATAALAVLVQHENIWGWPLATELRDLPKHVGKQPIDPLYLQHLARLIKRLPARNIEEVLVQFDQGPDWSLGRRFAFAINQIFSLSDSSLEYCHLETFLRSQFAMGGEHTFISFNYDLALDRCLQRVAKDFASPKWRPSDGYGFVAATWDRRARARSEVNKGPGSSGVILLKPHGSLSWLVPFTENYSFKNETPCVIVDGADDLIAYHPEFDVLADWKWKDGAFQAGVYIVPPGSGQRYEVEMGFLRDVVRREEECLQEAGEVFVIGWSLPRTDADQACLIRASVAKRRRPLDRITIVNYLAPVDYFDRLAELFRVPKGHVNAFNDGFRDFVRGASKGV